MSSLRKIKSLLKKPWALINIIMGIMLMALTLIIIRHIWLDKDILQVEFEDIFMDENNQINMQDDVHQVLRVAVAAMIAPEPTRRYYNDLLTHIGNKLGRRTLFLQRKTYGEVNLLLQLKKIDVAFVCSGGYVLGHSEFGMELLAVPVVNGEKVYYSYIIVHKNSPIQSFEELRGEKFAFTSPDSNSGKMAPTYMLTQRGETPESFFSDTFYTHSHDNSIMAVAEGLTDGAAIDSLVWEFMNIADPTYTVRTRIIKKSSPFGIPPVVVHPELQPELKQKLKEIFLDLHKHKKTASLLQSLQIDRFEDGEDSMYDSVHKIYKELGRIE